jgi:tetratricopeptide (TPR) repeat protein
MSSQSGELAMRPLPAVLLDLYDELATGKLSLRRGRVSKSVDLVNGNPVSTASTPRDETLGHFLVSTGVITEDQHRFAVARAADVGGKLGEALVALQILTVEQLIDQLGKQARHKLVQALRWPQGAWRFDESFEPIEGMQLRMVEVVLGGLKETAVETPERLARLDSLAFELTDRGQRLKHELKKTFGDRVVAALGTRVTIADIEKAAGDRAQGRMAIDAMVVCDAVTAAPIEVGLGAVSTIAVGRVPTRPRLTDDSLYDTLFDDLAVPEEPADAPLDFDESEAAAEAGVVSTEALEEAQSQIASARQAVAAEQQRLRGADHYATLMVGRRATLPEITAAYEARLTALAEFGEANSKTKIDDIRATYQAARQILADGAKRTAYDRELAGGELVQVAPAIDTELSFRIAEEHMSRRQWAQAIGHIKTVLQRAPNEADYHAALGWCEWKAHGEHAAAADGAHAHLNHALSINPDHAAAHDYKGRIDAALHGDESEAVFHLERALDLDPGRAEALATIESLLLSRGELRRLDRGAGTAGA